jgi:hypothetical protein
LKLSGSAGDFKQIDSGKSRALLLPVPEIGA